jgi:glutamate racemase
VERYADDVRILAQVCPGLVEAVEAGALDTHETECLVRRCLTPLIEVGVDQLVLGCTHYPFLCPVIERVMGRTWR